MLEKLNIDDRVITQITVTNDLLFLNNLEGIITDIDTDVWPGRLPRETNYLVQMRDGMQVWLHEKDVIRLCRK